MFLFLVLKKFLCLIAHNFVVLLFLYLETDYFSVTWLLHSSFGFLAKTFFQFFIFLSFTCINGISKSHKKKPKWTEIVRSSNDNAIKYYTSWALMSKIKLEHTHTLGFVSSSLFCLENDKQAETRIDTKILRTSVYTFRLCSQES